MIQYSRQVVILSAAQFAIGLIAVFAFVCDYEKPLLIEVRFVDLLDGIVRNSFFIGDIEFILISDDFLISYCKQIRPKEHCAANKEGWCLLIEDHSAVWYAIGCVFLSEFLAEVPVISEPNCRNNANQDIDFEIGLFEFAERCFDCHINVAPEFYVDRFWAIVSAKG